MPPAQPAGTPPAGKPVVDQSDAEFKRTLAGYGVRLRGV
jgi:hypothetical protein